MSQEKKEDAHGKRSLTEALVFDKRGAGDTKSKDFREDHSAEIKRIDKYIDRISGPRSQMIFLDITRESSSLLEVDADGPISPNRVSDYDRDLLPLIAAQVTGREIHVLEPNPDAPDNYNQVLVLPGFNEHLPGSDLRRDGQDPMYMLRYPDDHYEYLFHQSSSTAPPSH